MRSCAPTPTAFDVVPPAAAITPASVASCARSCAPTQMPSVAAGTPVSVAPFVVSTCTSSAPTPGQTGIKPLSAKITPAAVIATATPKTALSIEASPHEVTNNATADDFSQSPKEKFGEGLKDGTIQATRIVRSLAITRLHTLCPISHGDSRLRVARCASLTSSRTARLACATTRSTRAERCATVV